MSKQLRDQQFSVLSKELDIEDKVPFLRALLGTACTWVSKWKPPGMEVCGLIHSATTAPQSALPKYYVYHYHQ